MKTAMQELIEHIDNDYLYPHQEVRDYMDRLNNKIKELIEKEKEQTIDFAYSCTQHISREDIEEYYNKTFKQKK
jgi:hemerythrin-like domain-containing protein